MSVPGNSVSRYRGVGVASQTHSYADTKCGPAAVFSGGKTRAMQLTRTGHGISGFSFPSFDFTNDREHRRGIKGCGIRREREREREKGTWRTVAPLENYLRPARAEVLRYRDTRADTDTGAGSTCACSVQFYMQFRGGRRSPQDGGVFNYI